MPDSIWQGWTFIDDQFYAPEWRQGMREGDIRAIPYHFALIADLKKQVRDKESACDEALKAMVEAEQRARYYRQQLILESRYGLMLARINERS